MGYHARRKIGQEVIIQTTEPATISVKLSDIHSMSQAEITLEAPRSCSFELGELVGHKPFFTKPGDWNLERHHPEKEGA